MLKKLNKEEEEKLKDFMVIYKKYLNPNFNSDIDTVINYIFDELIKIYLEYKDIIPFISVVDDSYSYYILRPINGQYSLLDYLINTIIQNLDSIELIENNIGCNYNMLKKKIFLNRSKILALHDSVFNTMRKKVDREKYLELYYKNAIYHEIGHMFHYKMKKIDENTVYVPADYLSLDDSSAKKRMRFQSKKTKVENMKATAKEKIKKRIALYSHLSNKYNILSPEEIDECNVSIEKPNGRYEEIVIPPLLYLNPVDEAFSECDAQIYSGLFENDIFDMDNCLECFYLPIDDDHILMTYSPSAYSFSASIGFALKHCISKEAYFRTVFLGKQDLFIEFLGNYNAIDVNLFSNRLISADKKQMKEIQPLLDEIVKFSKNKDMSLDFLNIYFPLIYKDNKWVYYTESFDKDFTKTNKKEFK